MVRWRSSRWLLLVLFVLTAGACSRPPHDVIVTEDPAPKTATPPPKAFLATIKAWGDLDFSFLAYDVFGPGRIALGGPAAGGRVTVLTAEFRDGELQAASEVSEPMGALRDVTRGDMLNMGEPQAVVTTEKGVLVLLGTEKYIKVEQPDVEKVFVGDWDGDGRSETAYFHGKEGALKTSVFRYTPDGSREAVGQFAAPDFPNWAAVRDGRPGERAVLMGAESGEETLQITFYHLDFAAGLQPAARYPLHRSSEEPEVSYAAGELGGRPTLAISHMAEQSYVDLFDTAAEGMPFRGRVPLPGDKPYVVLIGAFTGEAGELLAITPQGEWVLYDAGAAH
ncbi:MAG TPA: hypothetical protein VD969_10080 [Symbiobacteriaceae bacterium]|nr:hypothetical protein [Symbiobacteriaceae bacterium]